MRRAASGDKRNAQRNADIASQEIENEISNLNTLRGGGSYFHSKLLRPVRSSTKRQEI